MGTIKHTGGNWKVFDSEARGLCVVNEKYTSDICRVETLIPREEAEANAKLIASAPQLLEHLESALTAIEIAINATPSGEFRNTLTELNIQSRLAIQKATT